MENLAQAIDTATALATEGSIDEGSRIVVLEAATKLVTVLQKPEDAITKLAYWVCIIQATPAIAQSIDLG